MRYSIDLTPGFKKDFNLVQKQNKGTSTITKIIERIADGERLETQFRDHNLKGDYKNYRECHIKPNLLLIYKIEREKN